jgi:predicted nucleic acid-binding Zn ribbon protein
MNKKKRAKMTRVLISLIVFVFVVGTVLSMISR